MRAIAPLKLYEYLAAGCPCCPSTCRHVHAVNDDRVHICRREDWRDCRADVKWGRADQDRLCGSSTRPPGADGAAGDRGGGQLIDIWIAIAVTTR